MCAICVDGGGVCAENMSSRSGHVDVNERRLRPIYGQDTLNITVTFLYVRVYTHLCKHRI